jgi:hypothetical protein
MCRSSVPVYEFCRAAARENDPLNAEFLVAVHVAHLKIIYASAQPGRRYVVIMY